MKLIIDIPRHYYKLKVIENGSIACGQILKAVKNGIPYEENEPKRGKWIDEPIKGVRYHCSLCFGRHDYEWPYCPSCGADMREATND